MENNDRYNSVHKVNINNFINGGNLEGEYSQSEKMIPLFKAKELEKCLTDMNCKTSQDPNGLSNKIIKELKSSSIMRSHLLKLFNMCIVQGEIPTNWKHSRISILLKGGLNASTPSSYRPISSTPCLARLFERLILSRLQDHLDKNNLIISNQSGFRKARQTKDNILFMTQTAQQAFNEGKKTLSIFLTLLVRLTRCGTKASSTNYMSLRSPII